MATWPTRAWCSRRPRKSSSGLPRSSRACGARSPSWSCGRRTTRARSRSAAGRSWMILCSPRVRPKRRSRRRPCARASSCGASTSTSRSLWARSRRCARRTSACSTCASPRRRSFSTSAPSWRKTSTSRRASSCTSAAWRSSGTRRSRRSGPPTCESSLPGTAAPSWSGRATFSSRRWGWRLRRRPSRSSWSTARSRRSTGLQSTPWASTAARRARWPARTNARSTSTTSREPLNTTASCALAKSTRMRSRATCRRRTCGTCAAGTPRSRSRWARSTARAPSSCLRLPSPTRRAGPTSGRTGTTSRCSTETRRPSRRCSGSSAPCRRPTRRRRS
mmetsp:Transcript_3019/g.12213  ORF Transcript_3019/g.12213 Transcript_3019/m.12213 type:complete len:334 (+) Transcript_3019:1281-2282(+)